LKFSNGQNIFEIIPLEVGSIVLKTNIENKKSLIIVFRDGFELSN